MMDLAAADYQLFRGFVAAMREQGATGAVVAAVSGGSDSMALLEFLALASDELELEVTVAYVDHRLRDAAQTEMEMVAAAAVRHGFAFSALAIGDPGSGAEASLRTQRYHLLESLAASINATAILTGHTRDDQTETVLFRLLRGAGRRGLAGMRARRGLIVRPLLAMSRDELRRVLRARGSTWVEDASNAESRYARNRLRHRVIPSIEREFGTAALEHLPAMAARWAVEDRYLDDEAQRFAAYVVRGRGDAATLDLAALDTVPSALRTRVLRAWLEEVAGGARPTMAQLEAVEELIASRDGSRSLRVAGTQVTREYGRLAVCAAATAAPDPFLFRVDRCRAADYVGPGQSWRVGVDPAPRGLPRRVGSVRSQELDLDAARLSGQLLLRPLGEGDAIETIQHGRRKVHAIMVDARLPSGQRAGWPVLAEGDRLIWVPGIALAVGLEAGQETTERLRLRWQRMTVAPLPR